MAVAPWCMWCGEPSVTKKNMGGRGLCAKHNEQFSPQPHGPMTLQQRIAVDRVIAVRDAAMEVGYESL